jgi:hypothetical protein
MRVTSATEKEGGGSFMPKPSTLGIRMGFRNPDSHNYSQTRRLNSCKSSKLANVHATPGARWKDVIIQRTYFTVTSPASMTVWVGGENVLVDNISPYAATSAGEAVPNSVGNTVQQREPKVPHPKRTCFVLRGPAGHIICRTTVGHKPRVNHVRPSIAGERAGYSFNHTRHHVL